MTDVGCLVIDKARCSETSYTNVLILSLCFLKTGLTEMSSPQGMRGLFCLIAFQVNQQTGAPLHQSRGASKRLTVPYTFSSHALDHSRQRNFLTRQCCLFQLGVIFKDILVDCTTDYLLDYLTNDDHGLALSSRVVGIFRKCHSFDVQSLYSVDLNMARKHRSGYFNSLSFLYTWKKLENFHE